MERRAVWAIVLMMVIAIAPAILLRRPAQKPAANAAAGATSADTARRAADTAAAAPGALPLAPEAAGSARAQGESAGRAAAAPPPGRAPSHTGAAAAAVAADTLAADTVRVSSPLYTYGISTRGARFVTATLKRYNSTAPGDRGQPVQLLPGRSGLLGMMLVEGRDTLPIYNWSFSPSAPELTVNGPTPLALTASREGIGVELTYTFVPDSYRVHIAGHISGVGPNGAMLLVAMGPGLTNTEADSNENHRALALVTKENEAHRTNFSSLKPGEPTTLSGPFEWVAVKSKYFTTAVLAFDSTAGATGVSGVTALAPPDAGKHPTSAAIRLSLPVGPGGAFNFSLYTGPLEYARLRAIGHDFDDVNPYGWPGVRTLIRFFEIPVRWLLVWMHEHLGLAYGLVIIIFGILVRVLLWPLNQKAMRASMAMQAIQPLVKEMQERYKEDPQRLQQEMFRLYKEHGVNPLGGCWPMLIPMPILFALYFVFQNTIELRGVPFLWLPDLARPDPLYIIPLLMGLSMFALSKMGQMGIESNPQMKTMLYVMPVMMTVLFVNFAAGLNLYYAVSNIASIPQQYLIARERMRRTPPPAPAPVVRTKPGGARGRG
ncbi:MAG TPA: membrane protein insertase YidC [Gemmatimonadales bacterium]|nr:membrane protein insertase YidC [Gemmatimonadales bacterium]